MLLVSKAMQNFVRVDGTPKVDKEKVALKSFVSASATWAHARPKKNIIVVLIIQRIPFSVMQPPYRDVHCARMKGR